MTQPTAASPQTGAPYARWTLMGIGAYVALDVVLQLLPPHYSPLHQAESDLAVGPYGILMNLNFLIRGLLTLSLLATVRTYLPRSALARAGEIIFGLWALCSALLAFFDTDILDDRRLVPHPVATWHGDIHLALALIGFIAAPVGAVLLSIAWARVRPSTTLIVLAMLALLALLGLPVFARIHDLGGLGERVFLFFTLLWTGAAASALREPGEAASVPTQVGT